MSETERQLYGTDGVRRRAFINKSYEEGGIITPEGASYAAAGFMEGYVEPGGLVVVGYDPRISSEPLAAAACEAMARMGRRVLNIGMMPTPAVARMVVAEKAAAGFVVSASHNPWTDNGFKIINREGGKLSVDEEAVVEARTWDFIRGKVIGGDGSGWIKDGPQVNEMYKREYVNYLLETADIRSLYGVTVVLDSANGAASDIANRVYGLLNAEVVSRFDQPGNGTAINANCGAAHLNTLKGLLSDIGRPAIGIAFDGDADRALLTSQRPANGRLVGEKVDGDYAMAIVARERMLEGIVATPMTNTGILAFLAQQGIKSYIAGIGDRKVAAGMRMSGFPLGGEQSGHLIDKINKKSPYLEMGDGIHTSLLVMRSLLALGGDLEGLRQEIKAAEYPQVQENVVVEDQGILEDPRVQEIRTRAEAELGDGGRCLVRPSGTEPMIRVLVEHQDPRVAEDVKRLLCGVLRNPAMYSKTPA